MVEADISAREPLSKQRPKQNLFPVTEQKPETAHSKLCRKALSFLNNHVKCQIAVSEMSCSGEIPDAIGWRYDRSLLIECKVSRADFLRNRVKESRMTPGKGLGNYRFYLCPEGVMQPDDLPEKWGLLHLKGNSIRKIVYPTTYPFYEEDWNTFYHDTNIRMEKMMLVALARRLKDGCPFIGKRIGISQPEGQSS
jgi:hypothetical protein